MPLPFSPKSGTSSFLESFQKKRSERSIFFRQSRKQTRPLFQTWFVLCPESNLFIENLLPDIELFRKNKLQICLGTDSLSSNHKLSILDEMKTIQSHFPSIPLIEIVSWATINGARALEMDSWAGTIEIGKRPGINLITGMDLQQLRLQPQSQIRKLI